ncbi:GDSL esterase/lipase At1g74460 [Linum perenne]
MKLPRSLAQASLPWYGIDFGTGIPNGRFTNGRTVADIIGMYSFFNSFKSSLSEDVILDKGVNYASGGGGILNETGGLFNQRISLSRQIELFQGTQQLITDKIGKQESDKFFKEARYVVALGSNDFINNYLMPIYRDSWTYNDQTFIDYLMDTLGPQLKLLHSLGARQLMVFGLGPMGCIPLQRVLSSSGECQERTNKLALSFNKATNKLVTSLSSELANATFRFGDAYDVVNNLITNPRKYGFSNSDSPCCAMGRIRPALTCTPASTLCKDRSKYVFWDEYHPSDSANQLIAKELIKKFGFLDPSSSAAPPSSAPDSAPSPDFASEN